MIRDMHIVIYRYSAEELDRILKELCGRLNVTHEYDKSRHLISIKKGLLHPVYIEGRCGSYEKLAGLRPDFYNVEDGRIEWILEQGASKVNGIKLRNVCDVLKIIDILKISETITLDMTDVSEIIKIAMANNEQCNTCIFVGKCFFAYSCLSSDYSHYIRNGDCK